LKRKTRPPSPNASQLRDLIDCQEFFKGGTPDFCFANRMPELLTIASPIHSSLLLTGICYCSTTSNGKPEFVPWDFPTPMRLLTSNPAGQGLYL
jgi:hypothetical protein